MISQQAPLEGAVRHYSQQVRAGEAPREQVAVDLVRDRGFVNLARAGSGHRVTIDEPTSFGGDGSAADPAELLLAAVGASLSVTITAHASLQGLRITDLQMALSAWMDPAAFFQAAGDAPSGVQDLRIELRLRSDEPDQVLREIVSAAASASPVVTSLVRAPIIRLMVEPTE